MGGKPTAIERNPQGGIINSLPPKLMLSVSVMFSAMSYGSISYNVHKSPVLAAQRLGILSGV